MIIRIHIRTPRTHPYPRLPLVGGDVHVSLATVVCLLTSRFILVHIGPKDAWVGSKKHPPATTPTHSSGCRRANDKATHPPIDQPTTRAWPPGTASSMVRRMVSVADSSVRATDSCDPWRGRSGTTTRNLVARVLAACATELCMCPKQQHIIIINTHARISHTLLTYITSFGLHFYSALTLPAVAPWSRTIVMPSASSPPDRGYTSYGRPKSAAVRERKQAAHAFFMPKNEGSSFTSTGRSTQFTHTCSRQTPQVCSFASAPQRVHTLWCVWDTVVM